MRNTTSSNKVSRSMQRDVRWSNEQRRQDRERVGREREQRQQDHRDGVDHGRGCVHCDVVNGR